MRWGLEFRHVKLGADHLLEHEVMIQVEDGADFGGNHRVAAQGELIVLLLLARQGPVGRALDRVDAVDDHDLQVRDRVVHRAGADGDAIAEGVVGPAGQDLLLVRAGSCTTSAWRQAP